MKVKIRICKSNYQQSYLSHATHLKRNIDGLWIIQESYATRILNFLVRFHALLHNLVLEHGWSLWCVRSPYKQRKSAHKTTAYNDRRVDSSTTVPVKIISNFADTVAPKIHHYWLSYFYIFKHKLIRSIRRQLQITVISCGILWFLEAILNWDTREQHYKFTTDANLWNLHLITPQPSGCEETA